MTENNDCLAKQAYSAYGAVTDFKNYQGLPMPKWEDLPEKIQQAWNAASTMVYRVAFEDGRLATIADTSQLGKKVNEDELAEARRQGYVAGFAEGREDGRGNLQAFVGEVDEQARIAREAGEVLGCLKRTGVAIICCFGFYKPGERAGFKTIVSVHNDHQALDLLREITKCWSDANHEDASGENSCGKEWQR